MTATISRGGLSPLAPVNATLAMMRARYGDVSLQGLVPGLVADPADGWVSAGSLLAADGSGALLAAARERWQALPHAAAALAWKCYSYWAALPAVVGYAAARRVPLMSADRVRVHFSARQPFVRLGLHEPVTAVLASDPIAVSGVPGLLVVPDETALLGVLRESLVERHLGPLLETFRGQVHLGHRTLWGSVASGVAYGLSRAADAIPGSTMEIATTLLETLDAVDLVDLAPRAEGGLDIHRRTCCLAFTLPTPKVCTTCCIRGS